MERQNFWNTVSRIMSLLNFVISTVYKNKMQMKKEKQYLQEITKYISVKQCKQKESTLRTIHRGPDH